MPATVNSVSASKSTQRSIPYQEGNWEGSVKEMLARLIER